MATDNKCNGYVITLDSATTAPECDEIINAISLLKGVISVDVKTENVDIMMARIQNRNELIEKIIAAIYPENQPKIITDSN